MKVDRVARFTIQDMISFELVLKAHGKKSAFESAPNEETAL